MPEELLMERDHPLSRYRRYYYGHRSQLQMEVKQIPLHISVQSLITNDKWDENETCATHS